MTDRDGRFHDSKACQSKVFTPDSYLSPHPLSSSLTTGTLNQTKPSTIANTDSEGDYETSSEGPHSPRPEFHQSPTTFGNIIPEFDESLLVSTAIISGEDSKKKNDPSASYTIIGSPRTNVTSKISDCMDQIESASFRSGIKVPLSDLEELEVRRIEYSVSPRIERDANKSESLPVITIATPWGSYEYPDVHMPAERLVSDSQVDIKEKMRLITACMDGSNLATSRINFLHKPEQFLYPDVGKDEAKPRDDEFSETELEVDDSRVNNRPQTPKIITVTSPKTLSEAFDVLPIIRNPDLGSDYTFPPSPSGSSLPVTVNNNAMSMASGFYRHRDAAESPRNSKAKKSSYDPLSRIEGELAPLQNELSEIRGKVRALNLDFNLSCIDDMSKFPKAVNWITEGIRSSHSQIAAVKDDYILGDYHSLQNQNMPFNAAKNIGYSNFRGNDQPRYQYPFANRSSVASACSYGFEEVDNTLKPPELIIAGRSVDHDAFRAQIFTAENCELEIDGISTESPRDTDRNLSPVYVCTSTPSISSPKKDVVSAAESEEETTESGDEKALTSPEIRLPDFLDKVCIVPIAYLGGMPDPPAEPVFSFADEKTRGFEIGHKVLRIEHPDAPPRGRDEGGETTPSLSDTILSSDSETEVSLSARKDEDNSSVENSLRPSDRISVSKFVKKITSSHFSASTGGKESHGETYYIRGLISGPEDFL